MEIDWQGFICNTIIAKQIAGEPAAGNNLHTKKNPPPFLMRGFHQLTNQTTQLKSLWFSFTLDVILDVMY
jgi:hypothetical protein